jgi:hypothetical protein
MRFTDRIFFIKENVTSIYRKEPLSFLLFVCIVLVTAIKFSLIGTGFLSILDEFRYTSSGKALLYFSDFKISAGINALFLTQGRPVDAVLNTILNAIQLATANIFNLNFYESLNSYPLFIYNFFIYCFILIVHFKFSRLVFKDNLLSLISVLLFSSLTNSYIYLRHALPYDASLLIFYIVIFKAVKLTIEERLSYGRSFILGLSSFLGYLVYPGYFPLLIVGLFILLFYNLSFENFSKRIYHLGLYILGSIFCLTLFEVISRFGGRSYILDTIHLSGTIIQGSFEESFSFIVKYLFEVEGLSGVILMIGLILFVLVIIYQIRTNKKNSPLILLGSVLFGLFIAYASTGFFMHKLVFYGRLLHQFIPFICIFSLFSINEVIKNFKYKQLVLLIIPGVFIINFSFNFFQYKTISYPRDVAWEISKTIYLDDIENICEVGNSWSLMPKNREYLHSEVQIKREISQQHTIIVTNCCAVCSGISPSIYHEFKPSDGYILLESNPHFINFKAYQYEGYNIIDRQNIDDINLHIKIFSKSNNGN